MNSGAVWEYDTLASFLKHKQMFHLTSYYWFRITDQIVELDSLSSLLFPVDPTSPAPLRTVSECWSWIHGIFPFRLKPFGWGLALCLGTLN